MLNYTNVIIEIYFHVKHSESLNLFRIIIISIKLNIRAQLFKHILVNGQKRIFVDAIKCVVQVFH